MSFTIVQSPAFAQRGIALNESSCVEQVNGLIEVQARFTIPKSRQAEIDRLFFVDAQPPIDPSCVTKASLLTQRLYMVARSVTSESGFLVIDASYVGALARPGSQGFYLTEEKGAILRGTNLYSIPYMVPGIESFVIVEGYGFASRVYTFEYFNKEITVEFVQISSLTATAIPELTFDDLFVFVKLLSVGGPDASLLDSQAAIFGSQLRVIPSVDGLGPRAETLISTFNKTPVRTVEPATFVTPTVKIAKVRYSL
jgi:hypothetical protein